MYGEEVPTLPIQGGLSSSLISKWVITHCTRDKTWVQTNQLTDSMANVSKCVDRLQINKYIIYIYIIILYMYIYIYLSLYLYAEIN